MPRQVINIGIVANDGSGDSIRIAGQKINNNFEELYAETAVDSYISFDGNNIISNASNADINIVPAGTGTVVLPAITIDDNEIRATRSNDNLVFSTQGSGGVQLSSILFFKIVVDFLTCYSYRIASSVIRNNTYVNHLSWHNL